MPRVMADRFQRWFEYEKDVHAKTIRSLESVPTAGQESPEFQKAVKILAHVAAARRMWLGRLGVLPPSTTSLFPENPTLPQTVANLREAEAVWTTHLAALDDDQIAQVFEYQSIDGVRFRNRIEDILSQLYGHSWYHRGQIAMLVRAAGGQPEITDFIYWCREPV